MPAPSDIAKLVREAAAAIERGNLRLPGTWGGKPRAGSKYGAGVFEIDDVKWVACRAAQDPRYARLLDTTAGFMTTQDAEHAVAILDPAKGSHGELPLPDAEYRRRLRGAALEGLGIVWATSDADDLATWSAAPPLRNGDFSTLGELLEARLFAEANATWIRSDDSKAAERFIKPILDRCLAEHGFRAGSCDFPSFWRNAKTDGAWFKSDGPLRSIALEVKVKEDCDAPFGQIIDDLGNFDAVLHVRVVANEAIRRDLESRSQLPAARAAFEQRLPVKSIYVRFCSICERLLTSPGLDHPNLVCIFCDKEALGSDGSAAFFDARTEMGDNPVWIRGRKCWRRYHFGGFHTMADSEDLPSIEAYYKKYKGG
jgi:hypothetical protein